MCTIYTTRAQLESVAHTLLVQYRQSKNDCECTLIATDGLNSYYEGVVRRSELAKLVQSESEAEDGRIR